MSISIREYQNKDKKRLIEIMNDFQDHIVAVDDLKRTRRLPEYGVEYMKKTLKELTGNDGVMYVAENEQKEIIGIVAGIIQKPTRISKYEAIPDKCGRITEVYLEPEYRGKKLGKLLMETIET